MSKNNLLVYIFILFLVAIFSYGFLDPNFLDKQSPLFARIQYPLFSLVYFHRPLASLIYLILVSVLYACYLYILSRRREKISLGVILKFLIPICIVLLLSFPAFSNDIFNYLMEGRILALYRENPYLVKANEFVSDPMLGFLHWANKTSSYGPLWIIICAIPALISGGKVWIGLFSLKMINIIFYCLTIYALDKISKLSRDANANNAIIYFSLNPLVLMEVLISSHNDIAMISLAMLSFYLLLKGRNVAAIFCLVLSALIKYVTIILIPLYMIYICSKHIRRTISADGMFAAGAILMFVAIMIVSFFREFYSWYLLWVIVFVALLNKRKNISLLVVGLSFGLLMRFLPFLYTGSWGGPVPALKKWLTWLPFILIFVFLTVRGIVKKAHENSN